MGWKAYITVFILLVVAGLCGKYGKYGKSVDADIGIVKQDSDTTCVQLDSITVKGYE